VKSLVQACGTLLTAVSAAALLTALRCWQTGEEGEESLQPHPDAVLAGTSEDDIGCVPPPPPPPADLDVPDTTEPVLGASAAGSVAQDAQRLWLFLQQETYRQRAEGFRHEWAFHLRATAENLGAPLARSARRPEWVRFNNRDYGFQPFARDTLFNEIPLWSQVQSLNSLLSDGEIPPDGLARALLEASFRASGAPLRPTQAFAQVAVREQLGLALTDGFTITVDGERWDMQVFALDTLTSPVGQPGDVRRLSELPAGTLRESAWHETYQRVAGSSYDPGSPFHKIGAAHNLGTPLTGVYRASLEGNDFDIQVFAVDTLYARPGRKPARKNRLPRPMVFDMIEAIVPELSTADDAVTDRRFTFNILPIAGQPRISQFYGYTRFAAGVGRIFYMATQGRHSGVDFAVPLGTPLLALDYGLVVWAGQNVNGVSFGAGPLSVIVRYGDVYALYGHVSSVLVSAGDFVSPGQQIALSGFPSAPHLHFELRPVPASMLGNRSTDQPPVNPGYAVNPLDYFSPDLNAYFTEQLERLGGSVHFCRGSSSTQERITFGAPLDNRPCVG
jgi:murein DD-endopeptidase MepM/ murein hydrolase activator NlpD